VYKLIAGLVLPQNELFVLLKICDRAARREASLLYGWTDRLRDQLLRCSGVLFEFVASLFLALIAFSLLALFL
jgi:hypothetical protein